MQDKLSIDLSNSQTPKTDESVAFATLVTPNDPTGVYSPGPSDPYSQESTTSSPVSKREVKVADTAPTVAETTVNPVPEQIKVEIKVEEPEFSPLESPVEASNEQWKQILQRFNSFLNLSPEYLAEFFEKYKQPLVSVGLILLVLVSIRLLSGVLDAVNDIPFVAPTLELIGLGYSAWFAYRYLLGVKNREELARLTQSVKEYVFGKDNTNI